MCLLDEMVAEQGNADTIADPAQTPKIAASACSYNEGGLTCGCPGYVNDGAGYCITCKHSGSFHW